MPRYTTVAIALHWVIALLIIINVTLTLTVEYFPESAIRTVIDTHKSTGITVLGLVLLRLIWRFRHAPPALPANYPRLERAGAHAAHIALYALMLALPLSGWLHDSAWKNAAQYPMSLFGTVPWPRIPWIMNLEPGLKEQLHEQFGALHRWLGYALYALFALHVAGALKHQWVDRHPQLQRMWPARTRS